MPSLAFERACGVEPVCGIDEAGRGPLAGPVVAAAVVLTSKAIPRGVDDSKKLSASRRAELAQRLRECATVGIGLASVAEIDSLNILQATFLAMRRAVEELSLALGRPPANALVDGNRAPALPCPVRTIVDGDAKCLSIAAASIIAKVARDRLMADLAQAHPQYGWERNAGYGTTEHLAALERHGPTPHHRASFRSGLQLRLGLVVAGKDS
jgi:ribonuclease HII